MMLSALAVSISYRHSERLPASSGTRTFKPLRTCALHIRVDGVDLDLVAIRHQQINRGEPKQETITTIAGRRAKIGVRKQRERLNENAASSRAAESKRLVMFSNDHDSDAKKENRLGKITGRAGWKK
jgi:hypothetical protein